MKKLIIIIGLLLCSSVSAEWVYYAENIDGRKFWYEDENIRLRGGNVYVWQRMRYSEKTKFGYRSVQVYIKINCDEYSFQNLQATYYTDFNWRNQSAMNNTPSEKIFIPPGSSSLRLLADIVCKKVK